MIRLMQKLNAFQEIYRYQWRLSNLKESFVKLFLESHGYEVRPLGRGVMNPNVVKASLKIKAVPDFAVYYQDYFIAFVEVTGANSYYDPRMGVWINLTKAELANKVDSPYFFVCLFISRKILRKAVFVDKSAVIYHYEAQDIIRRKIKGVTHKFVHIPWRETKPLKDLPSELEKLRPDYGGF